jgi:hypothetical protein
MIVHYLAPPGQDDEDKAAEAVAAKPAVATAAEHR